MSRTPTTTTNIPQVSPILPEPWLTRRQIAKHYAFLTRWVERQTAAGMPGRRIGGERRYKFSEVDEWLVGRRPRHRIGRTVRKPQVTKVKKSDRFPQGKKFTGAVRYSGKNHWVPGSYGSLREWDRAARAVIRSRGSRARRPSLSCPRSRSSPAW